MKSDNVLRGLPELYQLYRWANEPSSIYKVSTLCTVECGEELLPVYQFDLGASDVTKPTVIFVGGVHGVERIGTQVLLSFMHTLFERCHWDTSTASLLASINIVFIPLLNPGGMLLKTRANPNGVDLMRNAPLDAKGSVSGLLGGHRISRILPWYRGTQSAGMELESGLLCDVVMKSIGASPFTISVDCHSGFGNRDRIWFPYAYTADPFDDIGAMYSLRQLFRKTHPTYSFYRIEPQAHQYTTHGDLWDYVHLNTMESRAGVYLPLTLEMGSWLWVKKNPSQLFNTLGVFNPVKPHRHERVLRRHQCLFEFLIRASASYKGWLPESEDKQDRVHQAIDHWYK